MKSTEGVTLADDIRLAAELLPYEEVIQSRYHCMAAVDAIGRLAGELGESGLLYDAYQQLLLAQSHSTESAGYLENARNELEQYVKDICGQTGEADTPTATAPVLIGSDRDSTRQARYAEAIAARREKFFNQVGHLDDKTGVDAARVEHFAAALSLHTAAGKLIINLQHGPELSEAFRTVGVKKWDAASLGEYYGEFDTGIVYRDEENTDTEIERAYIHEVLGHHAGIGVDPDSWEYFFRSIELRGSRLRPTHGFTVNEAGFLLEEGWAYFVEGTYAYNVRLVDSSDVANSSPRYEENDLHTPAAQTWDVLFDADPSLIEDVMASRSNPLAMEEVIRKVNAIRPKLFETMMRVPSTRGYRRTRRSFTKGLGKVLEAAGYTRDQLDELSRHGKGAQYVNAKIAAYERTTGYRFT